MILCIKEEHPCEREMEAAALLMIGYVLQSLMQCRCLETECLAHDCDLFLSSLCMIVDLHSDCRAALLFFQNEWALSQFRVVAPFLWCQKLYSWSETTESAVWTWLGHRVQWCLVQNPSICLDLNETFRSHQTFLKWVSNPSAQPGHRNDRGM